MPGQFDPWTTPPFVPPTMPPQQQGIGSRLGQMFTNPQMLGGIAQLLMARTGTNGGYAAQSFGEQQRYAAEQDRLRRADEENRAHRRFLETMDARRDQRDTTSSKRADEKFGLDKDDREREIAKERLARMLAKGDVDYTTLAPTVSKHFSVSEVEGMNAEAAQKRTKGQLDLEGARATIDAHNASTARDTQATSNARLDQEAQDRERKVLRLSAIFRDPKALIPDSIGKGLDEADIALARSIARDKNLSNDEARARITSHYENAAESKARAKHLGMEPTGTAASRDLDMYAKIYMDANPGMTATQAKQDVFERLHPDRTEAKDRDYEVAMRMAISEAGPDFGNPDAKAKAARATAINTRAEQIYKALKAHKGPQPEQLGGVPLGGQPATPGAPSRGALLGASGTTPTPPKSSIDAAAIGQMLYSPDRTHAWQKQADGTVKQAY